MKSTDRPKPVERSYEGLNLTPEEGFVLSRIDGRLTMKDLVDLTGIDGARVEAIVTNLATKGVVAIPQMPPPPSDMKVAADELETLPMLEEVTDDSTDDLSRALAFARDAPADLSYEKAAYKREEKRASSFPPELEEVADELEEVTDEEGEGGADGEGREKRTSDAEDAEAEPELTEEEAIKAMREPQTFRQIYEEKYKGLEPGARAHYALNASARELYVFCFDPDPKVIHAVLQNQIVGMAHARFIATWHSTSLGLEHIGTRAEFLRDAGVSRRLLRNTHLSEAMLKRLIQPKRLGDIFKASIDKDIPQLTRTRGRGILRQKFTSMSQPEERAELIVQTEGRCLPLLVGCTFDGRTTQMLCSRQYNSMIFVQNLAKFPACPPLLLTHLIKQPSVRRNQGIKKMLLQHKNMPSDAKKYA